MPAIGAGNQKFFCTSSPNLSDVSNIIIGFRPSGLPGSAFTLTGAALTAQSVENILVSIDLNTGASGNALSVDLSGGTSSGTASLTPAALAARNSIVANGGTVTLNA